MVQNLDRFIATGEDWTEVWLYRDSGAVRLPEVSAADTSPSDA